MNAQCELNRLKSVMNEQRRFAALLKLRQAVSEERYEECRQLIQEVSRYRDSDREIRRILADPCLVLENMES